MLRNGRLADRLQGHRALKADPSLFVNQRVPVLCNCDRCSVAGSVRRVLRRLRAIFRAQRFRVPRDLRGVSGAVAVMRDLPSRPA